MVAMAGQPSGEPIGMSGASAALAFSCAQGDDDEIVFLQVNCNI